MCVKIVHKTMRKHTAGKIIILKQNRVCNSKTYKCNSLGVATGYPGRNMSKQRLLIPWSLVSTVYQHLLYCWCSVNVFLFLISESTMYVEYETQGICRLLYIFQCRGSWVSFALLRRLFRTTLATGVSNDEVYVIIFFTLFSCLT